MAEEEIEKPETPADPKAAARESMLKVLTHFRYAVKLAARKGQAQLGILSAQPNGEGMIIARVEAKSFFDDLALLLDAPPQTEDDDATAAATRILHRMKGG